MKQRKHVLVLEITFTKPVTAREARNGADLLLERLDLEAAPVWAYATSPYAQKLVVKDKARVDAGDRALITKALRSC